MNNPAAETAGYQKIVTPYFIHETSLIAHVDYYYFYE